MHFKFPKTAFIAAAFVSLGALAACGRLDEKPPVDRILPNPDAGCYDKLGDRVSRYFDGNIEVAEWEATFECVKDQITFFKKYVRGADPDGYNRADIAAMVRKFLIVERPVSDQFISSIFDIKASAFGGSATVISPQEVDEFLRMSEVLRKETLALLPVLRARRASRSSESLLQLSDGIGRFGERLARYLRGLKGTHSVAKESYLPFIRELIKIHGGNESILDQYGDFARNLKVVIAAGSADAIEARAWPTIVQEGTAIGGLLLAYRDMEDQSFAQPEERDQFMVELARRMETNLNRIIRLHGVGIPLEVFDPVIDTLPWDGLNPEKRAALKSDLRPIVERALGSGVPNWLTSKAVATVVDIYEAGMRSQIHLKKIYRDLGDHPQKRDFEIAARRYHDSFGTRSSRDRDEVASLIEISKTYVGLFSEDSGEMQFTNAMRETRSRNHMIRMSWFKIAMRRALAVYGTGAETAPGRKSGKVEDLAALTADFHKILKAWKLAHPELTIMEMATKRFREANLFMPISNGDVIMDDVEATYYLAFLFSSSSFSRRIFRQIAHEWKLCPIVGVDELGQDAFSAECFRRAYFGNTRHFWTSFPGLQAAFEKMNPAERLRLADSMETAARRGGKNESPIGPFDIDSYAALPHYVEDIMERFDVNDDEVLDKREILDRAYPIFRETLAKAANQRSNVLLRGILTYIIHHGEVPPSTVKLLAWIAVLPFTNVVADRNDLYNVVALLSSPIDLKRNTSGSSWPAAQVDLFPTTFAK